LRQGTSTFDPEKHNIQDVSLSGSDVEEVTFHDAAEAQATGAEWAVGGKKTLTVEIYGTSSGRTVEFKAKGPSGTARAISGIKLSDFSTATSTTGTGELWQFDVTGLTSVIMDLTAVADGNVSVKGKAVA